MSANVCRRPVRKMACTMMLKNCHATDVWPKFEILKPASGSCTSEVEEAGDDLADVIREHVLVAEYPSSGEHVFVLRDGTARRNQGTAVRFSDDEVIFIIRLSHHQMLR